MDAAKIRLSPEEAALVVSADWILTKNRVMQKAMDMLGLVQAEQNIHLEKFKNRLPQAIYQSSPKIARGENYLGLPWLMLDFPRSFNREDTFAIRTFFWWGNFFSVTLHLSGIHKNAYEGAVINNFEKLKSSRHDRAICQHDGCVEVYRTGGLRDGELVGYAIRFRGYWIAYVRVGMGYDLSCLSSDENTAEQAVRLILES